MARHYLIVDDSRLSRMMVKAIVKDYDPDAQIIEAADGDEALAMIEPDTVVDIAIVDYNMPGRNGLELFIALQEVIQIPKRALLTANIQNDIRQQTEQAGITFINKPVDENTIRQYIAS